jgi:hypothetical protein
MIPDPRVAEVVSRLTGVPVEELENGIPAELPLLDGADSLDRVELMMDLKEEFDEETIRWGLRFAEALIARASRGSRDRPAKSQPSASLMWDGDLDDGTSERRA